MPHRLRPGGQRSRTSLALSTAYRSGPAEGTATGPTGGTDAHYGEASALSLRPRRCRPSCSVRMQRTGGFPVTYVDASENLSCPAV
ncbi:hypothetical protein GCM10010234_54440 [Streptomyces hawaiiensis]